MHDKHFQIFYALYLVLISIYSTLYAQIPNAPQNIKTTQLFSSSEISSTAFIAPSEPGSEHVFVVYNINSSFGDSIASYYQTARQIPQSNICAIACDTSEVISREYYNTYVRDVLRDSLTQRGLKEQIRFIVLTKGVPLKISDEDMSSTDSELCLLFNTDYSTYSRINNPYFGERYHFESFTYSPFSGSKISYLVSRLDAFTLNDVLAMIDRGANPDTTGTGWYILDDQPALNYDKMFEAKRILDELGQNAIYDNTTSHIIQNPQGAVMGYCGHGVHASAGYPFVLNTLDIELANGALFNTYESFNGYSFLPEGRATNHNLVADFIAIGGTGGIGHVYEPYSSSIPHENILFARYANGYPLIEAAYMSMAYLSWQNVVVGDPLCRIKSEIPVYDYAPFTKIAIGDIVNDGGNSTACAWGDYDNDGYQDLFVANEGETNFLYKNNGDGSFNRIINSQISTDIGNSKDCIWGDYDNDGYLDLYVSNVGRNFFYHNDGLGNFNRIYNGDAVTDNERSYAVTWIDLNNDGNLDLFDLFSSGSRIFFPYMNDGVILNRLSSMPINLSEAYLKGFIFGDYDKDGDPDLFLANDINSDYNKNDLYINNDNGSFSIQSLTPLTTDAARSYGANWVDYDQDDDLDLFVTNGAQDNNFFYLNNGNNTFSSILTGIIPNDCGESRGSVWIDYDNDGDLDLFVSDSGHNSLLYNNNHDGTFTKLLATDIGLSSGCAWADYDNDGDLDLFVANSGNNFLYRNDYSGNNWLQINLQGSRSNAAAIGARIQVKAAINGISVWQTRDIMAQHGYGTHNSLVAHFGLADANSVDSIKIIWPSEYVSEMGSFEVNQILTIAEPETPKIAFSANRTYFQSTPAMVQFKDLSVGNISSWKWYFGTGDSSSVKNPQYVFPEFGEFDITLITQNSTQNDTLIKRKYIIVDQFIKTSNIGLSSEPNNGCCNWTDYNSDGLDDLYIGTGLYIDKLLYKNLGNGSFEQITNSIILNSEELVYDATWGDYDNDGDSDLFTISYDNDRANNLYENNGDGTFTQITSGLIANDMENGSSCGWVDYNNDGWLDLLAANEGYNFLYKGIGGGEFIKIDNGDIVTQPHVAYPQGWSDYDNDGDMDVFIGNIYSADSYFYINNGNGTFTRDLAENIKHQAYSCTWGDYNNDGFQDLFLTDWPTNILFKNNGDGSFSEVNAIPTGDKYGMVASWADFNNDGYLDLVIGNFDGGTSYSNFRTVLYKNKGDGSFSMIENWQINNDGNYSTGLGWADYDNDGDLDLFLSSGYGAGDALYNNWGNNNKWLKVKCTGVSSNRDAIGARVKILTQNDGILFRQYREISAKTSDRGQNSLVVHFGLGKAEQIDSLTIYWPSGIVWDTTNVQANQFLKITERVVDPPPVISSLPLISFNEDDSLSYPITNWYPYVTDSTDNNNALSFKVTSGKFITSVDKDSCFLFRAEKNWFGRDTLKLLVSDRSSTVQADLIALVFPVNDPPIISKSLPDSIFFGSDSSGCLNIWSFVEDPDQVDSLLTYRFPLRGSDDSLIVNYSDSTGILCLISEPDFMGNILMYVEVEDDSGALAIDSIMVIVSSALGLKDAFAIQIPDKYNLYQNFPNPFNPLTKIKFALPKAEQVKIEIYSSLGQKVETIINKTMKAGYHEVEFSGQYLSSGIYFYRIQAGEFQDVKKMILIK